MHGVGASPAGRARQALPGTPCLPVPAPPLPRRVTLSDRNLLLHGARAVRAACRVDLNKINFDDPQLKTLPLGGAKWNKATTVLQVGALQLVP